MDARAKRRNQFVLEGGIHGRVAGVSSRMLCQYRPL